jgi:hypothetical protein
LTDHSDPSLTVLTVDLFCWISNYCADCWLITLALHWPCWLLTHGANCC